MQPDFRHPLPILESQVQLWGTGPRSDSLKDTSERHRGSFQKDFLAHWRQNSRVGRRGKAERHVLSRSPPVVVPARLTCWPETGGGQRRSGDPPCSLNRVESPAWVGLRSLESEVFWIRGKTDHADWCWTEAGWFGAHLRTPKVGLGDARTYFLGDGQGDGSCRNCEGSLPPSQAGQSLGPQACHAPGNAGMAE